MSKDAFNPTVFRRGYMGDGENRSRYGTGLQKTKKYLTWFAMMQRCYSENSLKRKPTYENCEVCEEWWNFQVFCKWFDENYYEIPNHVMCLDKDILVNSNKIYSPETCCFVPQQINKLLTLRHRFRGELPLGVKHAGNKYTAVCNKDNVAIVVGRYDTIEDAVNSYYSFKKEVLKSSAEKYKEYLPNKTYLALCNFEINQ